MDRKKMKGIVFDIQSFSTHDGPGIRTNIFLKGCPLRCVWCANPEGQKLLPELFYTKANCQGCFNCVTKCSKGAISPNNENPTEKGFININRKLCEVCDSMECMDACFNNALSVTGKLMSVDEVMKIVRRDQPFYRQNGGVTLSGGDPFMQHEFALEILKACKAEFINTAMETELCAPFEKIEAIFPYVDFFLCDLKVMDEQKHIEATCASNKQIMENLRKMAQLDANKILVRVPIIPEYTDSIENLSEIGKFCKENGLLRVNILPYHKLGQMKFEKLGLEYKMPDVSTPSKEYMETLKDTVEHHGIHCIIN